MDVTQIAFGFGLLAISGVTFLAPSALDTGVLALVAGVALVVGAVGLCATVARETHST